MTQTTSHSIKKTATSHKHAKSGRRITHGHDGLGTMILLATLYDTGNEPLENFSGPGDTPVAWENHVVSFKNPTGTDNVDALEEESAKFRSYVSKSLGAEPDDEQPMGPYRAYLHIKDGGGARILRVIPALAGETLEQVKADPAAAAARATAGSEPGQQDQRADALMAALFGGDDDDIGGGIGGGGMSIGDDFDDEDDSDDDDRDARGGDEG